jgi:protein-tyrosine kinase
MSHEEAHMDVAVGQPQHTPLEQSAPDRIGEILIASGVLKEADVAKILRVQNKRGLRFGEAAVALRYVNERDLRRALAQQAEFPFVVPGESALSYRLAAAYEPFAQYAEGLRTLRSQLSMRWLGSGGSALAIAAPRHGDGCSTLAGNLAIVFAQLGERTLLIDTDMRNPSQHDLFGLDGGDGLAELLNARLEIDDAIQQVPHFDHLCVLPAGSPPPNPQELLSRLSFTELLTELGTRFDVILLDTPPLLQFADAQIVAARAGACVLGTRRNGSTLDDIARAKAQLNPSITNFLGAVISD